MAWFSEANSTLRSFIWTFSMRTALFALILLSSIGAQGVELASPTGNPLSIVDTNDYVHGKLYERFGSLTFQMRGGLLGSENTLQIQGSTITWEEKTRFDGKGIRRSAAFSALDRQELVRQLRVAQFKDLCGKFQAANVNDEFSETMILSIDVPDKTSKDEFTYRIENIGDLAPSRYMALRKYLWELMDRKFPRPGQPIPAAPIVPVFRSLRFSFLSDFGRKGRPSETQLSIQTSPRSSALPPIVVELYQQKGVQRVKSKIAFNASELDELVGRINKVPWEEIAGTYSTTGEATEATSARMSISFSTSQGTRSMEVAGLVEAPSSYQALKDYLRKLIARASQAKNLIDH